MIAIADRETDPWHDAAMAVSLFAVDPPALGGVVLRAPPGPPRDRWLALLRERLPEGGGFQRIPVHVSDEALFGGLDLPGTLAVGRPVFESGLLARLDGGIALVPMAERLPDATAARLAAALDTGEIRVERDGFVATAATRFAAVALDEGLEAEERVPSALSDRLGIHLDLSAVSSATLADPEYDRAAVAAARARAGAGRLADGVDEALCAAAATLGIASLRAPLLALRAVRIAAALAGRRHSSDEDVAVAARLVLAPRATVVPAPTPEAPTPPEPGDREGEAEQSPTRDHDSEGADALEERVLEAAAAAIPPEVLARLRGESGAARPRAPGRAGAVRESRIRGRPSGVRRGRPGEGARVNVVETLRAAAPWQMLRRRSRPPSSKDGRSRLEVRGEDFRLGRYRQRSESTAIFVVDASGSAALHRLAEAKGAVELLLAECYVRRDRVAVIAFRGRSAEVLLPPTRSLLRAKRSLAGLPGGGGTPLAAAIETAADLAEDVVRRGGTPLIVFLTDARANVARDGRGGREAAMEDARVAARRLRGHGFGALLIDTSRRPEDAARSLANEMGADYLPLPQADASALFQAVRDASEPARGSASSR